MDFEKTPDELYDGLRQDAGPKFLLALKRIKDACDAIVAANGVISYSQVGKVAEHMFGGPKVQSILNNAKHKDYIDARKNAVRKTGHTQSGSAKPKAGPVGYPSDGLDYKTRRYIDDLRQRNSLLEAAMRDLKQQILSSTERTPLDLSKMISSGPANDGSLNLVTQQQGHLTDEAKEAIRIVVEDLPKLIPAVESMQGKALRLRTGEWLLSPLHFSALKLLLQ